MQERGKTESLRHQVNLWQSRTGEPFRLKLKGNILEEMEL